MDKPQRNLRKIDSFSFAHKRPRFVRVNERFIALQAFKKSVETFGTGNLLSFFSKVFKRVC